MTSRGKWRLACAIRSQVLPRSFAKPYIVWFGFSRERRLSSVQTVNEAVLKCGTFLDAGDEAAVDSIAFERLFREQYPRLVRTVWRITGSAGQAEEVASETFCRLHRQHDLLNRPASATAWLFRTATHLGLDALRSDSRRAKREEIVVRGSESQSDEDPLGQLLAEEERSKVRQVLRHLKPIHAQVLLMIGSGFSCREIAEALDMKTDSVYMTASRARAQFEKQYVSLYGRV